MHIIETEGLIVNKNSYILDNSALSDEDESKISIVYDDLEFLGHNILLQRFDEEDVALDTIENEAEVYTVMPEGIKKYSAYITQLRNSGITKIDTSIIWPGCKRLYIVKSKNNTYALIGTYVTMLEKHGCVIISLSNIVPDSFTYLLVLDDKTHNIRWSGYIAEKPIQAYTTSEIQWVDRYNNIWRLDRYGEIKTCPGATQLDGKVELEVLDINGIMNLNGETVWNNP